MADLTNQDPPSPADAAAPTSRNYRYLIVFCLSLFAFLALFSYDDEDTAFLAGGMGDGGYIRNWMAYVGAYTARFLLLAFGFGGFVLFPLLMLTSARRFAGGRSLKSARWDYWVAMLLVLLGSCMLFGSWPDFLGDVAITMNIAMTTGGVLGQRLCDPKTGWLQLILNPTCNGLAGVLLLLVGLGVVGYRDWGGLLNLRRLWHREPGTGGETGDGEPEAEGVGKRLSFRRTPKAKPTRPDATETAVSESPAPEAVPESEAIVLKASTGEDKKAKADREKPAPVAPPAGRQEKRKPQTPYDLPVVEKLNKHDDRETAVEPDEVDLKKRTLQATLDSFGIEAAVGDATCGPRVTLFEVLPAPGVKVERISQISNNIAMELRAVSLRVLTPIPGRNTVGIEVPNAKAAVVSLRGLMQTPAWKTSQALLPLLIGRNISGGVVVLDLAKAPHLLIAGATGSGKSVCINALIMSLIFRFSPDELRMIMVDPKVVEFRAYEKLPHLVVPVISDVKRVPLALRWVILEMERRYRVLAKVNTRNLESFNARPPATDLILDDQGLPIPARLPYIVVVIDELADIIMTAKADVETYLARIAQLARAVGIHAIIATQRPSVNVITGTIKANFPTRIAFQVTSQIDSRTILDVKGAETLLGRGDMLFKPPGASKLERIQSTFVEDEEIERVVAHCASQAEQQFEDSVFRTSSPGEGGDAPGEMMDEADEELIEKAIEVIVRDRRPTTSYVQRCLRIGYNRAALIMEILEQRGVVGPQVGSAPREILITGRGEDADDAPDNGAPEPRDAEDEKPA